MDRQTRTKSRTRLGKAMRSAIIIGGVASFVQSICAKAAGGKASTATKATAANSRPTFL